MMLKDAPPAPETACEAVPAVPDRSKQQGTDRYLSRGGTSPEARGIIELHISLHETGRPCIVAPRSGCRRTDNNSVLCYIEANIP